MRAWIVVFSICAISGLAQSGQRPKAPDKPPEIHGNVLGETVAQFVASDKDMADLVADCRETPVLPPDKIGDRTFPAYDSRHCDQFVNLATPPADGNFYFHLDAPVFGPLGHSSAIFENGTLALLRVTLPGEWSENIGVAIEKFGKPTSVWSDELQNSFGMKVTVMKAQWKRPGYVALADEDVSFKDGEWTRSVSVTMMTTAHAARLTEQNKSGHSLD